ncbi:hypothetical protein AB0L88_37310 [Saccharopolyspora shandongensis]|uniref:hypothetical protein n=1 Tax=Saccharopolyspora shandongensis TaxID=418495 RepID=UPI0015A64164|nr:hypothetical protein [Saccharopolyspora shandongensis]
MSTTPIVQWSCCRAANGCPFALFFLPFWDDDLSIRPKLVRIRLPGDSLTPEEADLRQRIQNQVLQTLGYAVPFIDHRDAALTPSK